MTINAETLLGPAPNTDLEVDMTLAFAWRAACGCPLALVSKQFADSSKSPDIQVLKRSAGNSFNMLMQQVDKLNRNHQCTQGATDA